MRILVGAAICLLLSSSLFGQSREIDSLKNVFNAGKGDRAAKLTALQNLVQGFADHDEYDSAIVYNRKGIDYVPLDSDTAAIDSFTVNLLYNLGSLYQFVNLDSAILLSSRSLDLAQQINYKAGEANASRALGENYRLRGDYLKALELLFRGLSISREIHDTITEADCLDFMGIAYMGLGEYRVGLNLVFQGMALNQFYPFKPMYPFLLSNIGYAYEKLNMLDSALHFQEKAAYIIDTMNQKMTPLHSGILIDLGMVHSRLGNSELAIRHFRKSIQIHDYLNLGIAQFELAELYYNLGHSDSSLYYARLAFITCKNAKENAAVADASRLLTKIFVDRKMIDSAFHYKSIVLSITDSLYSPQKFNRLQLLVIREQQNQNESIRKQQEAEQEKRNLASSIRFYGLLAALLVFLLIALILFRNNRQKQKANALLSQQKNEIALAMTELKTTQAQLVQSEKMASLGELTAGIAHEIQNPLNFVNNFSELNKELVNDLNTEIDKGNLGAVKTIAKDIAANEEKITVHGRRADSIVKGMLQHSRISTGMKELTDINVLCDEYLRLCFHGMRAKDKSFNANLETHFDPNLPKLNVVPQDLGRVLLNVCNNAFYAVNEKRAKAPKDYSPTVSLKTSYRNNKVEITVKDNGNGIPPKILDKIFQPFFTTKPTGQGTGLGLSLSYDMIKAHGGEIDVNSIEGQSTEFTIILR